MLLYNSLFVAFYKRKRTITQALFLLDFVLNKTWYTNNITNNFLRERQGFCLLIIQYT